MTLQHNEQGERAYDLQISREMLRDGNNAVALAVSMTGKDKDVLELGCATGYVTRLLSEVQGCRVTGVEYMAAAAEQARPYCTRLIVGDLNDPRILEQIQGGYDVILAGDVLEHLRDPESVLVRLRDRLKPGGYWVISVPNIAHWSVRKELLLGRFDYTPRGIMDKSHLRWFTARSLGEMLARSGYRVERREAVYTVPMQDRFKLRGLSRWLQRTRWAQGFFGYQIVVQAKPVIVEE